MKTQENQSCFISKLQLATIIISMCVLCSGCEHSACEAPDAAPCPETGSAEPAECGVEGDSGEEQVHDAGGDGDVVEYDAGANVRPLNLSRADDNVYAWRRVRGSLDPEEEVVYYWTGHIYAVVPEDPSDFASPGAPVFTSPLFRFEGFNVARFIEDGAGDYTMVSREAAFYENPRSGEILECWDNTLFDLPGPVRVLHVWNDPVNFGVGPVDYVEHSDRVVFFSDVFLAYRSPLAGEERFLPYSASDVYQGAEMFNFYVRRADLENEDLAVVPVEISWTRVGQFLPWMQMADRPGHLVYSVRGWKLENGFDGLPEHIRQYVEDQGMDHFAHAPEQAPYGYSPNATTWRNFASAFDSGEYEPTCE
jgi:hypothetical protein